MIGWETFTMKNSLKRKLSLHNKKAAVKKLLLGFEI